jgi:hypothetical protein
LRADSKFLGGDLIISCDDIILVRQVLRNRKKEPPDRDADVRQTKRPLLKELSMNMIKYAKKAIRIS